MGISVQKQKDGRFKLTHSVSDHQTEAMTREEAILYIHRGRELDLKLSLIEEFMAFPFHWSDGSCRVIMDNKEGKNEYFEWVQEALREDNYEELVEKKFEECMKALNKDGRST
jgi:signal recognition particle subunit SEC65